MHLSRRAIISAGAGLSLCGHRAIAAQWPERAIRLTIGFPPGGSLDGVGRPLLAPLEKLLGQPVVMDYRPGAAGATAAEYASRAPADGYALTLIEGGVFTALPYLRHLSFDPVKALAPLGMVAVGPGAVIVAHPSLGVSNVPELVRLAKSRPREIDYGTSGVGGAQHLVAEYFHHRAGIKMTHVPYKGGAQAMTDLLGGQIKLLFSSMAPAIPFVKSGRINALGVTSPKRSSSLPAVPTVGEQDATGIESEVWVAVAAPRGVPASIADRIAAALSTVTADSVVQTELENLGFEPSSGSPAEVLDRIDRESRRWVRIIKDANITVES